MKNFSKSLGIKKSKIKAKRCHAFPNKLVRTLTRLELSYRQRLGRWAYTHLQMTVWLCVSKVLKNSVPFGLAMSDIVFHFKRIIVF